MSRGVGIDIVESEDSNEAEPPWHISARVVSPPI